MITRRSWQLVLALSLGWLAACSKVSEPKTMSKADAAKLEAESACLDTVNNARLKFSTALISQPAEKMFSAEGVLAERRHNEQMCLAESQCLDIDRAELGVYLEKCLKLEEHGK